MSDTADKAQSAQAVLLFDLLNTWYTWRRLFVKPAEPSEPNQTEHIGASDIANLIHYVFIRWFILGVARLVLDNPDFGNSKNLTLAWVLNEVPDSHPRKEELRQRISDLRELAQPLHRWRHKLISHNDVDHLVGDEQVDGLSIALLDQIASDVGLIVNDLWLVLYNGNIANDPGSFLHAADGFANSLRRGRFLTKLENYAWRSTADCEKVLDALRRYRSEGVPDWLSERLPNVPD